MICPLLFPVVFFKFADDTKLYRAMSNSSDILSLQGFPTYIYGLLIGSLVLIYPLKCILAGLPLTVI